MSATGPDFLSLQVRDLDASQAFYQQYLGTFADPDGYQVTLHDRA